MRNSKLFPYSTATARAKEQVARAGRMLEDMQRALRNPDERTHRDIATQALHLSSAIRSAADRIPVGRQLIRLASSIEQLAREQQNSIVHRVLNGLGSAGQLLRSWLRGAEGQQHQKPLKEQIRQAVDLLTQFQSVDELPVSPEHAGGRRLVDWQETALPQNAGGGNRLPPGRTTTPAPGAAGDGSGGDRRGTGSAAGADSPHPNVRVLPNGNWDIRGPGYHRQMSPNDLKLTGEMRLVQSSNVHAIGFAFNFDSPTRSMLVIRYKQKDRRGSGSMRGGPTYEYGPIHPDWFDELVKASSKGKWVWDELRIRGTVAGHQYPYNLTRAAQGYLPRRAMVRNQIQRLVQRERTAVMADGSTVALRSPLPNAQLGRYSPTAHKPNVGNMDRGSPNRGAPNRGR